jgi:hypothetical protein
MIRKLHNEEFHNLYSSPKNKDDKINDVVGRTCNMNGGNKKYVQNFGWGAGREETTWIDLDVDGSTTLKWIVGK